MDIIFSASIIAAFLAGMVALFAPCCITVLLPAYLASAFRQKKNVLKMTLIFFSGIAVVLVPIGLGAAALAQVFRDFHEEMYIVGGIFMLILGILAVLGKNLKLPFVGKMKLSSDGMSVKSVFGLGVLSGAATSCCAPVLAGAITLAVVSGVFWKALVVTFAYVFGMVFPLFLAAYFYDRFKIDKSKIIQGKLFVWRFGKKEVFVHSTNLLAAGLFVLIGFTMLYLGLSGNAFWSPHTQASLGRGLNAWSIKITNALEVIPSFVWGAFLIAVFSIFVWRAFSSGRKKESKLNKKENEQSNNDSGPTSCH